MTDICVFHGIGVIVTGVHSDTLFTVISAGDCAQAVDFTREDLQFTVELSRTPNRVGKKSWPKVTVDDRGIKKDGTEHPPGPKFRGEPLLVTSVGSGTFDAPALGEFAG